MLQLLLWLALFPTVDSAPCVNNNPAGAVEATVPKGTTVRLCFETPENSKIQYFRIRRSQTQEGFYDFWQRLYPADCITSVNTTFCGISFTATRNEHFFVTTVYDDNGTLRETVGSSHARVIVTP